MQVGRCVVGYVQDDMYPLLNVGVTMHEDCACGGTTFFFISFILNISFILKALVSLGQASGLACFPCISLNLLIFICYDQLISYTCRVSVLFGVIIRAVYIRW